MSIGYTKENPAQTEPWEITLSKAAQVIRSSPGMTRSQIAARLNIADDGVQNILNALTDKTMARAQAQGIDVRYYPYSKEEQKRVFDAYKAKVAAAEDIVHRESWYQSAGDPVLMKVKLVDLLKTYRTMTLKNAATYLSQPEKYILDLALELRPGIDVKQLDQFGQDYQLTLMSDPGFKSRPSQTEFQQAKTLLSDIEYKRVLAPWEAGY